MVSSFPHLYRSYLTARSGHMRRPPILRFRFYLERELVLLEDEIKSRSYRPRKKREFIVFEPKQRKIFESHFRDRVVHHAVCSILNPRFENRSLAVSYACRKGFGNLKALDRLRRQLYRMEDAGLSPWMLKVDIRKYFESVPHDRLLALISRDTEDQNMFWLVEQIVRSHEPEKGKGLPIGNLTSQIFANLYLNELDHFLVHGNGFKHVYRFMDDILIVHKNREDLKSLLEKIKAFCHDRLQLEIHPNKIFLRPAKQGLEFIGFHVTDRKRTIKPTNMARIKKRLRRFDGMLKRKTQKPEKIHQRLQSWKGYAIHGQTRFQFEHLTKWSAEFLSPEMAGICRAAFSPKTTDPSQTFIATKSNANNTQGTSYRSPLDRMQAESKSAFFQALQSQQPGTSKDSSRTKARRARPRPQASNCSHPRTL